MTERAFTLADLAACAEREVRQRQRVYPRLVEGRRMSQAEADRQIAMMAAIAARLRAESDAELVRADLFGAAP